MPEQLIHYVGAVSGRRAVSAGGYAAHIDDASGHAVLVAYPGAGACERYRTGAIQRHEWEQAERSRVCASGTPAATGPGNVSGAPDTARHDPHGAACAAPLPRDPEPLSLASALAELARQCRSVTVLAPFAPREAPKGTHGSRDCFWDLPLPPPAPGQKLRNMLARAGREVVLRPERWGGEHAALVRHYLQTRSLRPGTRAIFSALEDYLSLSQDAGGVVLLAARKRVGPAQAGPDREAISGLTPDPDPANAGRLEGFSIADYSALRTAFYLFSFRRRDAPPGTADLLLQGLIDEGVARGHESINLGLGVNPGVEGFKKKWGARPCLPYVETTWEFSAGTAGDKLDDAMGGELLGRLRSWFRRA